MKCPECKTEIFGGTEAEQRANLAVHMQYSHAPPLVHFAIEFNPVTGEVRVKGTAASKIILLGMLAAATQIVYEAENPQTGLVT